MSDAADGVYSCDVSIMMPAYNAEQFVAQAIDSALAQSFKNWELVVVDDGSTDRTGEIAAGYSEPRFKVVRQTNRGEAAARNAALACMRGMYVAFLDADDLFLPQHLEATVGYLRAHPEHAGVYTDGYYITEEGRRLKKLSTRRRGPSTGRVFDEVVRGSDFFGPPLCLVLRRETILRHRLRFDEEIGLGTDWDFFLRFADVGTFGYVDQATCLYRLHQTNLTFRVGSHNRVLGGARCRMKAIKMGGFAASRLDVRVGVFYDLLVVLLREYPELQRTVIGWSEFAALPRREQAKLLRLMASSAVVFGGQHAVIREWLRRSCCLNPADVRSRGLFALYRVSPALCRTVLRLRWRNQTDPLIAPPFAELASETGESTSQS